MHHIFGVGRTLCNLGEIAEMKQELPRARRMYSAAKYLFNQVGSPYEEYVSSLLNRLGPDMNNQAASAGLAEKNIDDLVRWTLDTPN